MNTYYYIPNAYSDEGFDIENAYQFDSSYDIAAVNGGYDEYECRWLVEDMAKEFFNLYDGWEIADRWHDEKRGFAVWDSDRKFVGVFDVMLEYEPTFSAWKR